MPLKNSTYRYKEEWHSSDFKRIVINVGTGVDNIRGYRRHYSVRVRKDGPKSNPRSSERGSRQSFQNSHRVGDVRRGINELSSGRRVPKYYFGIKEGYRHFREGSKRARRKQCRNRSPFKKKWKSLFRYFE